jgi:hypothetical protein
MSFLTHEEYQQLLNNGSEECRDLDHYPVVKFFLADSQAVWLLTDLDPEAPDIAFGLCDLGLGFPELGSVSLAEIEKVSGQLGLPVEKDQFFKPRFRAKSWFCKNRFPIY